MKSMQTPLVSIITPVHNRRHELEAVLASVRDQTRSDWEHLLVDDASSDGSGRLLDAWAARDERFRPLHFDRNRGPARARNAAIEQARGRFIAFLDSDDHWAPEKLARQIAFMHSHQVAFAYSAYDLEWPASGRRRGVAPPPSVDYRRLLNASVIATSTAIYDTAVTGKVFMPDIYKRQDLGLWLRLLRVVPRAHGQAENLAVIRKQAGSLSSNKLSALGYTWRLYREHEGLPAWRSAWHLGNSAVRAGLKYLG